MRRPLCLLLLALTLFARNAGTATGPSPRPATAEGTVVVETRTFDLGFGPVEGRIYFLEPAPSIVGRGRISLMVWAGEQSKMLDRAERDHSIVRIKGFWTDVNGHDFLTVMSIEPIRP